MKAKKETAMDKIVCSVIKRGEEAKLLAVSDEFEKAFGVEKAIAATEGVVRYTLVRLALGISAEEATMPLSGNGLCPVSCDTLNKYAESVMNNCQQEIAAVRNLINDSKGTIGTYLKRQAFYMPDERDDEYDDNDPINGWHINAKDAELHMAEDWARSEKDNQTASQIQRQRIDLSKNEAMRGNPLAIFYLGVRYFNASGVEKDVARAAKLLVRAEMMGVKRASSILFQYFG